MGGGEGVLVATIEVKHDLASRAVQVHAQHTADEQLTIVRARVPVTLRNLSHRGEEGHASDC